MTGPNPLPERVVIALAATAAVGAWWAAPVPRLLAASLAVVAMWRRWQLLLVVAVGLLASGQAAVAWADVEPAPAHPVDDLVTLVTDPRPVGRSVVAEVRHNGQRYSAWFDGVPWMLDRLAGERLRIVGHASPRAPDDAWLAPRGVVGSIDVDEARWWQPGSPVSRLANGLRRTLVAGTGRFSDDHRSLVLGFVLGDDRFQSDLVTDDFRGAGLGHLLAVSGQNVAFVLVLAKPVLDRLEFRHRLPLTLAVIGFFALLTRFEPSVLRASAMAAVAALGAASGHPAAGRRLLAVAVAGLLMVRPLLVHSLAFQLSVLASTGILVLSPVLARRLPGPGPVRLAVSVTVAAQLAVAPLLLATIDDVPVAALPANVVAAPAAGPISAWMLTVGVVAGLVGDPVAGYLHIPTRLLVWWVAGVARWSASLPLGSMAWLHLLTAVFGGVLAVRARRPTVRRGAVALMAIAVLAPAVALRFPGVEVEPAEGVRIWRSGGATVVRLGPEARGPAALAGVRRAGVRRIDLLVVTARTGPPVAAAGALARRYPVADQWDPIASPVPGSVREFGGLAVSVVESSNRSFDVLVDQRSASSTGVGSDRAPRARAPPPFRCHHPCPGDGHPQPHP
ncbi:MAG: ComEC/Rec2 family competence protein [Acidimicrobiia bacterium]|nr:ComEC/Rec2 family competence protein [Acidimicrobiia bacterium]